MREVLQTETFAACFVALNDKKAKARIAVRIDRLSPGNSGDARPVGGGVSELRIDYGPGYRVYFVQRGPRWSFCLAATRGRKARIFELLSPRRGRFRWFEADGQCGLRVIA
jgi:putative addiction module killer protein